ncbi:MAG TPA: phosphoenolpyruvate--protein phosphotransferase, partial [Elusimicrobia bacterium]|nr:phosphoenolpyruvate--protein phosphotransferase [Elusimicrobiota bacterium]
LLDAGGDKPLPFVQISPEDNPIVGVRGIRAFKRNEAFFRTQIRALLRLTPLTQVRIMLPMVTFADEIVFFKDLIAQEAAQLGLKEAVQTGAMIEVPSAALTSARLAKHADFFSIGTNDLTQYTLAIDRGHKILSAQADPLHPAVLKLISLTCQGAQKHNRPVAVCGAMAGDLSAVPFLIGLGVSELAAGIKNIAQIKALIRRLNREQCAQIAAQALELSSAQEVRALGRKHFAL